VGQIRRLLKYRIDDHRNHIKKNTTQTSSLITEHRLQHSHEFDWENVVILDKKVQLNKKIISETIYIKKQKKSFNL